MIWNFQLCKDSFTLITRPSKSLLTSRSSKSRETLHTIPIPLDLLPPGFQKQGPPPTRRTTLRYPQSEHEFLEARKNHASRISDTRKFELFCHRHGYHRRSKSPLRKQPWLPIATGETKVYQTKETEKRKTPLYRQVKIFLSIVRSSKKHSRTNPKEIGPRTDKSKQTLNLIIVPPQLNIRGILWFTLTRVSRPEVHYFWVTRHRETFYTVKFGKSHHSSTTKNRHTARFCSRTP